MSRNILAPTTSHAKSLPPLLCSLIRHTLTIIYTFSFFGSALVVSAAPAYASAVPGGNIANPNIRAVDLAKPAVVRIITTIGGRISVRFPTTNTSVSFPLNGGNYDLKLSGSGTFISSSGDIITADHVIKPPQDRSMDLALEATAAQDIADYVNLHYATSTTYTKDDVVGALDSGYFLSQKRYTDSTSEVYLSTDYTGPINAPDLLLVPATMHAKVDKVLKESAVNERDMAIIHVNMTNTPSVQFGDSSLVAQQDNLTIIGFPGNGDISERKDPTTFLSSSINKIFVSALKKTDSGADVIQVGGNVEHGDSGGPALDDGGNIVGIVSFGLEASPPYGSTFLQASNNAKNWLTTLHLDTRPGSMQKAWQQAFADYTSTQPGHWHRAQSDFLKLTQGYPNFKATVPFLLYANHEAQAEPMAAQGGRSFADYMRYLKQNYILLIIMGILVIVLLSLIGWTITRRGRKHNVTNATPNNAIAYRNLTPNVPNVPNAPGVPDVPSKPPSYPYMTGSHPAAAPAPDVTRQELRRSQGQYSKQPQSAHQASWSRPASDQDVIPTQPLRKNTQEHKAMLPYEP